MYQLCKHCLKVFYCCFWQFMTDMLLQCSLKLRYIHCTCGGSIIFLFKYYLLCFWYFNVSLTFKQRKVRLDPGKKLNHDIHKFYFRLLERYILLSGVIFTCYRSKLNSGENCITQVDFQFPLSLCPNNSQNLKLIRARRQRKLRINLG